MKPPMKKSSSLLLLCRFFSHINKSVGCVAKTTSTHDDGHGSHRSPLLEDVLKRLIANTSYAPHAIKAIDSAASSNLDLSFQTFLTIKTFVLSGDYHLAEMHYDAGGSVPKDSNYMPYLLESMIICYCRLGKFDKANKLMNKLFQYDGCYPSRLPYNLLLHGLCGRKKVMEALCVFNRMVVIDVGIFPSIRSYYSLIHGLCLNGKFVDAFHVFNVMIKSGTQPTSLIYETLVIHFCKWGRVDCAESLCEEMEDQFHALSTNKIVYNYLIYQYCKEQKMENALSVLMRMVDKGCELDSYTYKSLIHGFHAAGNVEAVLSFYEMMVVKGFIPDVSCQILNSECYKDRKCAQVDGKTNAIHSKQE
ncbi:hypothetical protein Sjap_003011 [Stephania japonica]|uniref:Pentatricopeptide repeat-containing protein n=1 Tax=Stephania japonica TaxID=461633 RepID=A0AAP0PWN8_9MAGN